MKTKLLCCIAILCLLNNFCLYAQTLNETQGTGSGINISTGDYNTMYGDSTGVAQTNASRTTFIGFGAGKNNSTSENTFIGYYAGYKNIWGSDNVFIGFEAGAVNNATSSSSGTGSDNTFIGSESGEDNTTGYDNTFVGEESGQNNTEGFENVFIGEDAGYGNTTGHRNTFIGNEAGISSRIGFRNTGIGNESLSDVFEGHHNTAVGDSSAIDIGVGVYNTVIGAGAGAAIEHANFNTFVGAMSGWDNNRTNSTSNANRNTYLGYLSGASNRDGQDNAGFGAFSGYGRADRITTGDTGYTQFNGGTNRNRTTFFGSQAIAAQNDVITMGYFSYNEGQFAIGIGNQGNMQNAVGAIGMGYQFETTDDSDYSIGIGYEANIAQSNAIGIGRSVNIGNTEAIAIGANTIIQNDGAIVIGNGAASNDLIDNSGGSPDATNNIAIGYNANVSGSNAIAIGNKATATNANTMVLGGATNPLSVGIGTDTPNTNASLELMGTNKGLQLNRLNNVQRATLEESLGETDEGLMVYDTEDDIVYTWIGAAWLAVDIEDNLGNHTATTNLQMGPNYIDFNSSLNGIRFSGGTSNVVINATSSSFHRYGPVTGFSIKNSMNSDARNGWTWGPSSGLPVAAINTEGKMQIANSLNIAGAYEFPIIDGTADQVLTTNGEGVLTWSTQLENQELSLATNTLSISGGTNSIDLSEYLDNTDSQELSLNGATLSISGGTNTVDLSAIQDGTGTDNQTLGLNSNTLSISNGNSVDLSAYTNTDTQNLTSATLTGTDLTIEIQNGTSVSVDLAPLISTLQSDLNNAQNEVTSLQTQMIDVLTRLQTLEDCACQILKVEDSPQGKKDIAKLYQNIPNPFNGTSSIKYYLPYSITQAAMVFSDASGKIISNIELVDRGDSKLNLNSDGLPAGVYHYTLYAERQVVDTKRMVIE